MRELQPSSLMRSARSGSAGHREKGAAVSELSSLASVTTEKARTGGAFKAIVIGAVADVPRALEHPAVGSRTRFDVIGVVPLDADETRLPQAFISQLLAESGAGVIIVAGPIANEAMISLGELAVTAGARLLVIMPTSVPSLREPSIVWEGNHPLIQLGLVSRGSWPRLVKRSFDVVVALVALLITAPIVLAAAIAVKLSSAGSVFFGHERVGVAGKRFRCWKLRTMAMDAEQRLAADPALHRQYRENNYKLPDCIDPRVTTVGAFLRRTSLDELPQFWNVLRGDMSLVGPRPVVAEELQHFKGRVMTLLSVRPGLTGAWAVGGRHHLKYPHRADVELEYVQNPTFRNDVLILLRTANALFDTGSDAR